MARGHNRTPWSSSPDGAAVGGVDGPGRARGLPVPRRRRPAGPPAPRLPLLPRAEVEPRPPLTGTGAAVALRAQQDCGGCARRWGLQDCRRGGTAGVAAGTAGAGREAERTMVEQKKCGRLH
jgi:hypothetical protein